MVGSWNYASAASNLGDGMEVDGQGLLDEEEDSPEQRRIVSMIRKERRRAWIRHEKGGVSVSFTYSNQRHSHARL
jgi:hypothetical protein